LLTSINAQQGLLREMAAETQKNVVECSNLVKTTMSCASTFSASMFDGGSRFSDSNSSLGSLVVSLGQKLVSMPPIKESSSELSTGGSSSSSSSSALDRMDLSGAEQLVPKSRESESSSESSTGGSSSSETREITHV